jgi:hypothetical protein
MSGMQSLGGLSDSPSQFSGKRFRSSLLEIGSIPDSRPRPEEIYSQLQQEQILALAIKQLKPGTPMATQFRDLDDRSVRETAQILGISAAGVKGRLSHGQVKLREAFKRFVETPSNPRGGRSKSSRGRTGRSHYQLACNARG